MIKLDLKMVLILLLILLVVIQQCNTKKNAGELKEIITVDGKKYEVLDRKTDTIYVDKKVNVPVYTPVYQTKIVEVPVKSITYIPVEVQTPISLDTI